MKGNFENTLKLTRFMLYRERVISSVWILSIAFMVVGLVPGMEQALDPDSREALFAMFANPSLVAMLGPAYTLAHETFGGLYTTMMLLLSVFTVALMNIFLVIRHTRTDEEKWRYEVVRSLPVGRLANLTAALMLAFVVNFVLAVIVGFGMYALGDSSMSFNGSMIWGASLGVIGLFGASVAALFSQLCASSRTAIGSAFGVLGFLYLLRAPGDMQIAVENGQIVTGDSEILSLISPFGLILRTEAYVSDYWWPVFIVLGVSVCFTVLAFYFNSIRDIDQGVIPARRGRAEGSFLLKSPSGLAVKLLRTAIIVWVLGMFSLGASYGTVTGDIEQFMASNEMWQQLMLGPAGIEAAQDAGMTPEQILDMIKQAVANEGFTLTELYMSTITNIMGVVTLVPIFMFMLRAKAEERDIRAELVLATPVTRIKYLMGYAVIAFLAAVVIQFVLAIGLYAVAISELADPSELSFQFILSANLVYLPAQWIMLGIAVLLLGLLPKATGIVWGYFAASLFIMFFGRMNIFPDWLQKLSPFGFVPQLPIDSINYTTMGIMTAIAALLTVAGFYFYSKRDINAITH
ncbi:MAG: hypothetical protein LBC73_01585 [Oscillospiraceae bacterium]|jgi:ABC-2 type transport system permease protein|nr:hypothetical protein [Oscillospiraceae bacterium]